MPHRGRLFFAPYAPSLASPALRAHPRGRLPRGLYRCGEGGAAAPAIVDGSAAAAGAEDRWASRIRAEAKELASVSFGECLLFTVAELYGCRADEYLGLHTSVRVPLGCPLIAVECR